MSLKFQEVQKCGRVQQNQADLVFLDFIRIWWVRLRLRTPHSTPARGQDDGSLHKVPHMNLIGVPTIWMGLDMILNLGINIIMNVRIYMTTNVRM